MKTQRDLLVSGASGFVGKNLIGYLNPGSYLIKPLNLRADWKEDLTGDVSAIIHLAGKAHDLRKVSRSEEYYQVNYELTKQLYDAFLQSKARKFIFISSVKAAADSVDGVLKEDRRPDPQTHYGKSKLLAEEYIRAQPLPEGKSYFILRPCMIHGPGNKGNLNLLYKLVATGIPYPLAAFDNKRSFLSVDNLCFVIKEIIGRDDIPGGTYNLADDEALSTNDLIRLLSEALGKRARLWKIPAALVEGLARAGDKLHLPLTTERLHKLTESYVVSNENIKLAIKKDLPLSARDGIIKTGRAFKNA
ncbi:NAD-dependent epimerase/dehydratase family protein [Flavihumibacter sp. R14]|nr:NAD-dependent epimerase/dehydratase family protein [Flavihumibacter soli]